MSEIVKRFIKEKPLSFEEAMECSPEQHVEEFLLWLTHAPKQGLVAEVIAQAKKTVVSTSLEYDFTAEGGMADDVAARLIEACRCARADAWSDRELLLYAVYIEGIVAGVRILRDPPPSEKEPW